MRFPLDLLSSPIVPLVSSPLAVLPLRSSSVRRTTGRRLRCKRPMAPRRRGWQRPGSALHRLRVVHRHLLRRLWHPLPHPIPARNRRRPSSYPPMREGRRGHVRPRRIPHRWGTGRVRQRCAWRRLQRRLRGRRRRRRRRQSTTARGRVLDLAVDLSELLLFGAVGAPGLFVEAVVEPVGEVGAGAAPGLVCEGVHVEVVQRVVGEGKAEGVDGTLGGGGGRELGGSLRGGGSRRMRLLVRRLLGVVAVVGLAEPLCGFECDGGEGAR